MAVEESVIAEVLKEVGQVGLWIQAVGIVIILWIVFQVIILINNRIKRKQLYKIEDRLKRIEGKINKLIESQ